MKSLRGRQMTDDAQIAPDFNTVLKQNTPGVV